jgi:hypothetical protein
MPWDRAIDLYLNVGNTPEFVLLASRATAEPAQRPVWVSGDKHLVRLWLVQPNATATLFTLSTLAAGDAIVLAGKRSASSQALLFSASGFALVEDEQGPRYEAQLDLTPAGLRDAFGDDTALGCTVDIEVQNSTNTLRRTRQFPVRINKGVYTNEVTPTPAEPAYPAPAALLTGGADTANLKRGTHQLVAGDFQGVAVAFATAFASQPSTVHAWLLKKAGAAAMRVDVNYDEIDASGFTVDLGDAVPNDALLGDYRIGWLAIL